MAFKRLKMITAAALVAGAGIFVNAPTASAATYTVDTLLGSTDLGNSGNAVELAEMCMWASISAVDCSSSLTLDTKDESPTTFKDDAGNWVIDIAPGTQGYFLLKFGTGNTGADSHYFFQNIADLTKLVFTSAQVNGLAGTGSTIEKLSHYSTFDVAAVPLPAAGFLLIGALGSLVALRRRRKSA